MRIFIWKFVKYEMLLICLGKKETFYTQDHVFQIVRNKSEQSLEYNWIPGIITTPILRRVDA